MNERSSKLLEEMVDLSIGVIKTCEKLPLPLAVINQLTKSVTSIGANFSEAQDASSRKDFINKIYIAKKEASETQYWLSIVARLANQPREIDNFSHKVQQFIMILQKIISTSRLPNSQTSKAKPSPLVHSKSQI